MGFRKCRIWMVRMDRHADDWRASCKAHGALGRGTELYAQYLAAIHFGNHS
jgi:hypothetical protein